MTITFLVPFAGFIFINLSLGLKRKPNFLVLEVDDFGYNDVSWNNPDMITPELARLAQEGVILDTFYTAPRCSPSRQEYFLCRLYYKGMFQKKFENIYFT